MDEINETLYHNLDIYKETYSFKIPWQLKKEAIDKLFQAPNRKHLSESFTKSFYSSSWHLTLMHLSTEPNFLQIYLRLDNASFDRSKMWIKTKFTIQAKLSSDNYQVEEKRWRNFPACFGFSKWILKDEIYKSKYWFGETLLIICEVDIKIMEGVKSIESQVAGIIEPLDESYTKLMKSSAYSDVTIKIGDKLFKAHRNILATRCEYFNRMFGSGLKESTSPEVELKEIEPEIFEVILSFIYSNRIPGDLENIAKDLLTATHLLELNALTKLCEVKLCQNINADNCLELLLFADLYDQSKLKDETVSFIVKNLKIIRKDESWKQFRKNHLELAVEILEASAEAMAL